MISLNHGIPLAGGVPHVTINPFSPREPLSTVQGILLDQPGRTMGPWGAGGFTQPMVSSQGYLYNQRSAPHNTSSTIYSSNRAVAFLVDSRKQEILGTSNYLYDKCIKH